MEQLNTHWIAPVWAERTLDTQLQTGTREQEGVDVGIAPRRCLSLCNSAHQG